MMFAKKRQVKAVPEGPLQGIKWEKEICSYTSEYKKSRGQTESLLTEMKETMATLRTIDSDTSSKEILDFLKKES